MLDSNYKTGTSGLDLLTDGVVVVSRNSGRLIDINSAACTMLGFTHEVLLALPSSELGLPWLSRCRMLSDAALSSMDPNAVTTTSLQRSDGTTLKVGLRCQPRRTTDDWLLVYLLQAPSVAAPDSITDTGQLALTDGALQAAILDALPATIALLDSQGVLVAVNKAWRQFGEQNGLDQACYSGIGSNYLDVSESDSSTLEEREIALGVRAVLAGNCNHFSIEYACHSPQQQRWFMMTVTPLSAGAHGAVVMHIDVTQKKIAEQTMRATKRRFMELLNNTSLVSVMLDLDGCIIFCNDALLHLTGLRRDDVIGRNWFETFMGPEHDAAKKYFYDLLSDRPKDLRHEDEIVKHNGERRLICWNSAVLHDLNGNVSGTASIGEDITEQRQSALKIRSLNANLERLSGQLLLAQEQERMNLARELHDELGSRLTLLKFNLHHLRRLLANSAALALWDRIDADVVMLIAQVRVISVSLRPPALDYLGLESAVRQLLQRQFATGSSSFVFEYAGLPEKLAAPIEIAVYRIVQESITNIVRHANARRVVVEINGGESGRELELIIRDNGTGFDQAAVAAITRVDGSQGGLLSMKQRVELLGGQFEIETSAEGGTRIVVAFKLGAP